mmetsp:Transcript_2341/g.5420  ORF Transcript_2341/g.5420 Transcript_2341/m.5420 type:complete len:242 (+) Transcript_2341:735-1460(+)
MVVVVVVTVVVAMTVAMTMAVAISVMAVVLLLVFEKLRLELEHSVQAEALHANEQLGVHTRALRLDDLHACIDALDRRLDLGLLLVGDEVDLVEQHAVGKSNLLHAFVDPILAAILAKMLEHMLGIHNGDNPVQLTVRRDGVVDDKGLGHWAGVRHAGSLDDDCVKVLLALKKFEDRLGQVRPYGATDTAVEHLNDLFVAVLLDDRVVDADRAKLVFDDRKLEAVVGVFQDVVDEGGLPCA